MRADFHSASDWVLTLCACVSAICVHAVVCKYTCVGCVCVHVCTCMWNPGVDARSLPQPCSTYPRHTCLGNGAIQSGLGPTLSVNSWYSPSQTHPPASLTWVIPPVRLLSDDSQLQQLDSWSWLGHFVTRQCWGHRHVLLHLLLHGCQDPNSGHPARALLESSDDIHLSN